MTSCIMSWRMQLICSEHVGLRPTIVAPCKPPMRILGHVAAICLACTAAAAAVAALPQTAAAVLNTHVTV